MIPHPRDMYNPAELKLQLHGLDAGDFRLFKDFSDEVTPVDVK